LKSSAPSRTENAKLKAEITELKKVVLENRARKLINQAHFDIVCEEAGIKYPASAREFQSQAVADF